MNPAARALGAAITALASLDAGALALGEPQVRSALGEALDVRIPVTLASGESIEPGCFKLAAPPGEGPRVTAGSVSLERSAGGTFLRFRGNGSVSDPAIAFSLVANCAGQSGEVRRDYTLALGTGGAKGNVGAAVPSAPPAAAAPSGEPMLPSIATLIARIGDTLASIAEAIFPHNHGAQRTYVTALRESNPALSTLGDNDPIPVDTPVSLPDLRTFARGRHVAPEPEVASAPAPKRPVKMAAAGPGSTPPPATPPSASMASPAPAKPARTPTPRLTRAEPSAAPAPKPAPVTTRPRRDDGFMLRLSAPEVDLARSRGVDDRSRQELRERLMILDADDQVSALLSLKHSVKQLESQVAALQLKLSGMPASFPPAKAAPEPAPAPAPVPTPPAAPKVEAAPVPAPKVEAPTAPAPQIESTPPPAPKAEEPPKPAPVTEPARPKPGVAAIPSSDQWMDYALWALAIVLALAAIVLGLRLARRKRDEAAYEEAVEPSVAHAEAAAMPPPAAESPAADDEMVIADEVIAPEAPAAPAAPRREIDSDVELATRLPSNTDDLRRRYIEERFPEIGKGALSLDEPDSVVKAARLFYEDGELARAVELLQYAVERNPAQVKSWLALFEIFRLERLAGEFAELAPRFREHHGKSEYWRKVQYFGREIDPGNPLYQEAPLSHFETISPTRAKRIAEEANFDPIAENWLGAPMDFENEVLANELRKTLMSDAGIGEGDLVPNPMPALRSIEMFTVA